MYINPLTKAQRIWAAKEEEQRIMNIKSPAVIMPTKHWIIGNRVVMPDVDQVPGTVYRVEPMAITVRWDDDGRISKVWPDDLEEHVCQ
jgi:hypothetical protein